MRLWIYETETIALLLQEATRVRDGNRKRTDWNSQDVANQCEEEIDLLTQELKSRGVQ